MSPVSFGKNISSLVAQRRLGEAMDQSSKIQGRLSSGLRINKASDDAASLAVLTDLNATSRVYTQGLRNLNDGVSLLSIADSTVSALADIVTRTRELSAQAANGTYSNTQRSALDAEAQALSKEYTRIIQSTKFNNINLFDGSLADGLRLQAGFGTDGGILSTLGGTKGTGSFSVASTVPTATLGYDVVLGDIDNDGDLDMFTTGSSATTVSLGNGDGTFATAVSYSNDGITGYCVSLNDLNNDGNLDMVSAGIGAGAVAKIQVRLGDGRGSFGASYTIDTTGSMTFSGLAIADIDNDGKLDALTYSNGGVSVQQGRGDGTFNTAVSYSVGTLSTFGNSLQVADVNGDGALDIAAMNSSSLVVRLGTGTGTFGTSITSTLNAGGSNIALSLGDINGDGKIDAVASTTSASFNIYTSVYTGNGDGTFSSSVSYQISAAASDISLNDIDADGLLDIVQLQSTGTNSIILRTGRGNGTFNSATSYNSIADGRALAFGDMNADGALDFVALGNNGTAPAISYLNNTESGVNPLLDFSLKTRSTARYAQSLFDQKLNQLSIQRGQIGAFQSRLSTALNSLAGTRDEYKAASARIGDADVASDSAEYIRTQILQNAATAVLAQANQNPSLGLTLLKNL